MMACFGLRRGARDRKPSHGETDIIACAAPASEQPPATKNACNLQDAPASSSVGYHRFPFRSTQESLQLLCTLQRDLCNLQSKPMEGRPAAIVNMILTALSASVVRLYGVSDDGNRGGSTTLVLLAAASTPGTTSGVTSIDEGTLGHSLEVASDPSQTLHPQRLNTGITITASTKLYSASPPSGDILTLLQKAIASMEPALHPAPTTAASGYGGLGLMALKPVPDGDRDASVHTHVLQTSCLYEYTTHGTTKSVALPLSCGTQLLGVLLIFVAAPVATGAGGAINNCGIGSSNWASTPVQQLLSNQAALQQLSLSASVALTCVSGPDSQPYFCWLASAMGRLAGSSTLQALISELTGAIEEHVRQRYLLELTVRAALVPKSGSDVAYMLSFQAPAVSPANVSIVAPLASVQTSTRPRRGHLTTSMDYGSPLNSSRSRREGVGAVCSHGGSGGGGGVIAEDFIAESCRALAAAVTTVPSVPCASLGSSGPAVFRARQQLRQGLRRCDSQDTLTRNASTRSSVQCSIVQRQTGASTIIAPGAQQQEAVLVRSPSQVIQLRDPSKSLHGRMGAVGGDAAVGVGITDTAVGELALALVAGGSTAPSMGDYGAMIGTTTGPNFAPPGMLRAKAFKLSHTLLQRLIGDCGGSGGGDSSNICHITDSIGTTITGGDGGRIAGVVVPSCGHWVQDVRQPARDLCLLMLAGSTPRGGGNFGSDLYATGGSAPGSSDNVKSLVLVCKEINRAAGVFLGLYLTFPLQLPSQLLDAIRVSCGELLHQVFGNVVQMKLREELSAEVDTLRLGVPGSYAVLPSVMISSSFSHAGGCRSERDRGDAEAMSCGNNILGGVNGLAAGAAAAAAAAGSVTVTGGEVRPPGRLARTITMTHLEVRARDFLSGHSAFDDHLTTYNTAIGTGVVAVPTPEADLVRDLELNMEFSGLKPKGHRRGAAPSVFTPATSARTLQATAEAVNRAPRGSEVATVNVRSLSGLLPAAEGGPGGGGKSPGLLQARAGDDGTTTQLGTRCTMSDFASVVPLSMGTAGATVNISRGGSGKIMDELRSGDLLHTTTAEYGGGGGGAQGSLPAASVLTVQEADAACSMRAHFGLLVESLLGTINSTAPPTASVASHEPSDPLSTSPSTVGGGGGPSTRSYSRSICVAVGNSEDLEEIKLYDILGEGASGVVLRGMMGTVPVATKLMEISHVDEQDDKPQSGAADADGLGAAKASKDHLIARHTMYRNAMELAVLRSTTHVNIVQCLGVFDNVILEHMQSSSGARGCVLRRGSCANLVTTSGSPLCTAIVTELCDSSLAAVLAEKTFPRIIAVNPTSSSLVRFGSGADNAASNRTHADKPRTQYKYDMLGVYLTVLEIALALRHLHSRRLVHRDLKPANVLLKNSPGDPRGWISKLADFGFTLMLDRQECPTPDNSGNRPLATSTGMTPQQNGSSTFAAGTAWSSSMTCAKPPGVAACYTVQEQACGTVTHMAPEATRPNSKIGAAVDIYALGILMWDIIAGHGCRAYKELQPDRIPAAVTSGLRPVFPDWVPSPYRKLAQACWVAEPHRRPTAAEVVSTVKAQLELLHNRNHHHQNHHHHQQQQQQQQQQSQLQQLGAHHTTTSATVKTNPTAARGGTPKTVTAPHPANRTVCPVAATTASPPPLS